MFANIGFTYTLWPLLRILLSILLYSPELILGVLRMVRATWAQATGSANWKPQVPGGSEGRPQLPWTPQWTAGSSRTGGRDQSVALVRFQAAPGPGQLQLQYLVGWVKLPISIEKNSGMYHDVSIKSSSISAISRGFQSRKRSGAMVTWLTWPFQRHEFLGCFLPGPGWSSCAV